MKSQSSSEPPLHQFIHPWPLVARRILTSYLLQVSFGEMVMCDNKDCPIEWFHFQCVGLASKPKGKWYCERCTSTASASTTNATSTTNTKSAAATGGSSGAVGRKRAHSTGRK